MTEWRITVRETGLIEAQCEHGVGHPIAESIRRMNELYGQHGVWEVHGCDGCCKRADFPTMVPMP